MYFDCCSGKIPRAVAKNYPLYQGSMWQFADGEEGCPILSTRFYRKKIQVLFDGFVLFSD